MQICKDKEKYKDKDKELKVVLTWKNYQYAGSCSYLKGRLLRKI